MKSIQRANASSHSTVNKMRRECKILTNSTHRAKFPNLFYSKTNNTGISFLNKQIHQNYFVNPVFQNLFTSSSTKKHRIHITNIMILEKP